MAMTAGLLALSCAKTPFRAQDGGWLNLGVCVEKDGVKSAMDAEELLAGARVDIYYADFSGKVRSYRYGQAPETIYLAAGEYRVDVSAGEMVRDEAANPSREQKSYAGSQNFTISGGQSVSVTVEARCCNVIASFAFDGSLAQRFESGYSVSLTMTDGDGNPVTQTVTLTEEDASAPLYFLTGGVQDPALQWTFSGTLAKDGGAFRKSGVIPAVEKGKSYKMTLKYIVKDGDIEPQLELQVDKTVEIYEDVVVFEPVSTGISPSAPHEIWAAHAIVHADVDQKEYDDPSEVSFEYSKDGSSWTRKAAALSADGSFEATLTGLTPSTRYSYRLVVKDEVMGDPVELKTDAAPNVPNASFEYTTNAGSYYEWYSPSAPAVEDRTAWWGSGNGSKANGIDGSADMGYVICVPDGGDKVDGSQSARLQSTWAVVKFGAGNLFSGYFGGLVGTKGGIVYYGRPFTARPSALKVWLKYSTGNVNRKDGYPSSGDYPKEGEPDWARVYVALGTWDHKKYGGTKECPIRINTTDHSTFHDYRTMQGSIAYGDLILKGSNGGWKEYTIPFEYSDTKTIPTHILISCAASMLGDYFTGCDSSKLWVDKMELVYE